MQKKWFKGMAAVMAAAALAGAFAGCGGDKKAAQRKALISLSKKSTKIRRQR